MAEQTTNEALLKMLANAELQANTALKAISDIRASLGAERIAGVRGALEAGNSACDSGCDGSCAGGGLADVAAMREARLAAAIRATGGGG